MFRKIIFVLLVAPLCIALADDYSEPVYATNDYQNYPGGYEDAAELPVYYDAPTPQPSIPYPEEAVQSNPGQFVKPVGAYEVQHAEPACNEDCEPNSSKFLNYVLQDLYARGAEYVKNYCSPFQLWANQEDDYTGALAYQAKLCFYEAESSLLRIVTAFAQEASLRSIFATKYGKEGPGVWYCRYLEFIEQVRTCYSSSLKYYPLYNLYSQEGNYLDKAINAFNDVDEETMPALHLDVIAVATCAFYNQDQVQNRGDYL